MSEKNSSLRKFLNIYWLRPENAMWRAANVQAMSNLRFDEPSLDLSCGDGLFSFLLAGGEFDPKFDIFHATDNLEEFFNNEDIYNATTDTYSPPIKKQPERSISVGTDWKTDLLEKAGALDFYNELVEHDNNEPLPFDTDRFKTVFSNSAYWIKNLDLHLSEISRITNPNGQIYLQVKLSHVNSWLKTLWADYDDLLGEDVIEMIDRGRSDNYAHWHTNDQWQKRFERCGLEVIEARPTATQLHSQMWDIGLRPISPFLIRMANGLPPAERTAIKEDWVDAFETMLTPLASPRVDYCKRPPAEMVYTLQPID